VDKPHFVVPVADLASGPKRLHWEISDGWLRRVLTETEAVPRNPRNGAGELDLELSMSGAQVVVRGSASVGVSMPCARTLEPVELDLRPEIFLMLEPAPKAETARRRRPERERPAPERPAKKKSQGWRETPELPQEMAAQDRYNGEEIVLDEFVREFILLELPMSPVQTTLPLEAEPARSDAPSPSAGEPAVDPRLLPLLAIKNRLKNPKE
jgi:uncharacterized metal-binding protein YceD (DUF177 family)